MKPRRRKGTKKRKIAAARVHRIDMTIRLEIYDQLSAMAGKESLVGTFEKIVEREFERRVKRIIPDKTQTAC